MSQEMRTVLQSILNSISNPAYIEQNGRILLMNKTFNDLKLDKNNIEDEIEKHLYLLKEQNINNNMKICELINDDLAQLERSKQNLTRAMALL